MSFQASWRFPRSSCSDKSLLLILWVIYLQFEIKDHHDEPNYFYKKYIFRTSHLKARRIQTLWTAPSSDPKSKDKLPQSEAPSKERHVEQDFKCANGSRSCCPAGWSSSFPSQIWSQPLPSTLVLPYPQHKRHIYHHREKTVKSIAIEDKIQLDFCEKNKKRWKMKDNRHLLIKPSEKFIILTKILSRVLRCQTIPVPIRTRPFQANRCQVRAGALNSQHIAAATLMLSWWESRRTETGLEDE